MGENLPKEVSAPSTAHSDHGLFQNEIYGAGLLQNKLPDVTLNPNLLEEQARDKVSVEAFNYVAGGAGEKATMQSNRLAFRQWKLVPRMLRGPTHRDLTVELFGQTYDTPILMAPIGVQALFHQDKETGLAEVCAEINVPFIMSTAASSTIEEVAAANGDGHRWYQLYWPQDDALTQSLLRRAKANGFKVLVVTLDTPGMAWRPADLDRAYIPFIRGIGCDVGFSDPVFREKFARENDGAKVEDETVLASNDWMGAVFGGPWKTWDDIKLLRQTWDGPIVLKGIQHPEDARKAYAAGCQGVIVSNHGGRQLDGAVGSLEQLPEIVDAVGDRMTVLFDSGIRTGVDVIKALSLGAKAVLVGRPAIYGLAVDGKEGARTQLRAILADLDQSMGMAGIQSVKECNRSILKKVIYGGDVKSNL